MAMSGCIGSIKYWNIIEEIIEGNYILRNEVNGVVESPPVKMTHAKHYTH